MLCPGQGYHVTSILIVITQLRQKQKIVHIKHATQMVGYSSFGGDALADMKLVQ